jgi:hypothetical protein
MSNIIAAEAATETARAEYPKLPPVVCEPWCRDGSGHTDAFHVDDQWCSSEAETRVPLTRERLIQVNDDVWALDDLRVAAQREFEGRPYVVLSRGDLQGVNLTADEAIALGEALVTFGRMVQTGATSV